MSAFCGAQKGSDLHWHPSMISPALLRQAEAWSGGELVSNPSGHAAQVSTSTPASLELI